MGEPASVRVDGEARVRTRRVVVCLLAAVALAIVMWGGYSRRWPWTGINGGTATLWDWLHLLLLPLAVVVLPVWFRPDTRVGGRTKNGGMTALGVFLAVVVLGYTIPWAWTGFRGNTVWDWLKLVVLPLAIVMAPHMAKLRAVWGRRHTLITLAAALAGAAIVAGGYLGPWSWTGFTGNTLWDWLNLLFLPLLVPTIVVPMLSPRAVGEVVYLDADSPPDDAEAPEGSPSAAPPPEEPPSAARPVEEPQAAAPTDGAGAAA
jgi:uncharacterized membrane protein